MTDKIQMQLACDVAEVGRVLDTVEEFGASQNLPMKAVFRFNLALDELITNIISYGFDGPEKAQIELVVTLTGNVLAAELTDNGKPFNPAEAELPEIEGELDEREAGGLGLRLIRTYMDRLDYQRDGALNRLIIQMNVKASDEGLNVGK